MDSAEFWQQAQPYIGPIVAAIVAVMLAGFGMMAIAFRVLGKKLDQSAEKAQQALEKSDIEIEKAKLDVDREKFYLDSTRDMFGRVKKLEEKDDANEKRILELIERDQEHEDVLTVLRSQRETQDKELIRLNNVIKELETTVSGLENKNKLLTDALHNAEEALKRAEKARDVAEQAHELKRQEWERDVTALRDELRDMQSRIGIAETQITQTQEQKGVSPQ